MNMAKWERGANKQKIKKQLGWRGEIASQRQKTKNKGLGVRANRKEIDKGKKERTENTETKETKTREPGKKRKTFKVGKTKVIKKREGEKTNGGWRKGKKGNLSRKGQMARM